MQQEDPELKYLKLTILQNRGINLTELTKD